MSLNNETAGVLHRWWHEVTQGRENGAARAARSILRRAHDITAVTLAQPYQHLFQRMCEAGWNDRFARSNDALAAVAGLLVHIETDTDGLLAVAMSRCPEGSSRACVSEARFRRLLEAPDLDALFAGLRRTLSLMQGGAPVNGLAYDVLQWARPDQRDDVKKRWAYSYVWPKQSV